MTPNEKLISKLKSLNKELSEINYSSIAAGLIDIEEGMEKIKHNIAQINKTNNVEVIHENMLDIQLELVNHIKPHITAMENPLMEVINMLDDIY